MQFAPVGIDIAKSGFQVHYVNVETGEAVTHAMQCSAFLRHFVNRLPRLIGMEACSGRSTGYAVAA